MRSFVIAGTENRKDARADDLNQFGLGLSIPSQNTHRQANACVSITVLQWEKPQLNTPEGPWNREGRDVKDGQTSSLRHMSWRSTGFLICGS